MYIDTSTVQSIPTNDVDLQVESTSHPHISMNNEGIESSTLDAVKNINPSDISNGSTPTNDVDVQIESTSHLSISTNDKVIISLTGKIYLYVNIYIHIYIYVYICIYIYHGYS
jgi:hypothetical protein